MNTWSSFIVEEKKPKIERSVMIETIRKAIGDNNTPLNDIWDAFNAFMKTYIVDALKDTLDARGIGDCLNQLLPIFRTNVDDVIALIDLINSNYTNSIKGSDLPKNGNILDIFIPLGFSKEVLSQIAEIDKGTGNIARGKYEVLLCLLLADITPGNKVSKHTSDVNTKSGGIELKCTGARTHGQNFWPHTNMTNTFISEMNKAFPESKNIKIDKVGIFSGKASGSKTSRLQQYLIDLYDLCTDEVNNNTEKIYDIIVESILSMYPEDLVDKKLFEEVKKVYKEFFGVDKLPDKATFDKHLNQLNFKSLQLAQFFFSLNLYFYHKEHEWNYIMYIGANADYIILDGDQFNDYSTGWNYISPLFNKFKIDLSISNTQSRNNTPQITYKG